MCQIFWCPEGVLPTVDILLDAAESNSDGAGFAFSKSEGVEFHKGYDTTNKDKWGEFLEDLALAEGKPTLIHFRWATHGGESMELTHPFIATPRSPLKLDGVVQQVIMHNGVYHDCYSDLKQAVLAGSMKMLEGAVSDTRILAALIGRFGWNITELLGGLKGDKVALLGANGKCEFFGPWQENKAGKFWYSNPGQFSAGYSTRKSRRRDFDMEDEEAWRNLGSDLRTSHESRANTGTVSIEVIKGTKAAKKEEEEELPTQTVPVTGINEITKEAVQIGLYKMTKNGWKFTPAGPED